MGMHTELHLNAELSRDAPDEVIAVLRHMLGDGYPPPDPLPDHPLFAAPRWRHLLTCDSYYFAADTHSTLRFDDIGGTYVLCVRSNLKNYNGEIEKFVDWIDPYLDAAPGDFLGFSRYEETEDPTLIRKSENL